MNILRKIWNEAFYSPRRHVTRLPFVTIGEGTVLLPTARFSFRLGEKNFKGSIIIGKNSLIGGEFVFESEQGDIIVGDRTFVNGGTRIICRKQITIGSDVTIAWGCIIYDHNSHSLSWEHRANDLKSQIEDIKAGKYFISSKDWSKVSSRPICIENKVWLGFDVTVLNGVTIYEGAIVGACSVVRNDIPAWMVAYGNPASPIKLVR